MHIASAAKLLSFFLGLSSIRADADIAKSGSSEVFVLTEKNHDNFLSSSEVVLVEYFAPWCGHCKKLAPAFEEAAKALKDKGIKLAHVNCDEHGTFCSTKGISGYPTLKVYKGGEPKDYDGARGAADIVEYMKRQIGPAVAPLDLNKLDAFKKEADVVIVGVFPEGSKEAVEFNKAAESLRNEFVFGQVTTPGVYMFKKFDDGFATYKGDLEKEAITKWVSTESMPLMGEVSPDNYAKYMAAGIPMAYLFYEGAEMRKEYGPIVEEAMRPYKGKINAVYIDAVKFHAHAKALMLPGTWPGFVIHELGNDLKYPLASKITKEEISKFVESFDSKKLEPSYRSEEIPEKDEGDVKTVVFKNFEKVVMDDTKDVLIELYAPWCGACKALAPIYEKLAEAYKPFADKVVIAKMDAMANDIPSNAGVKLTKFPTILLYKAGSKTKPIEFDRAGDSVKTFVDFISANAKNKVEIKEIPEVKKDSGKDKEEL